MTDAITKTVWNTPQLYVLNYRCHTYSCDTCNSGHRIVAGHHNSTMKLVLGAAQLVNKQNWYETYL